MKKSFKPAGLRVVATIEARMTSSRLPGKVLMPLAGKPVLAHIVERLRRVPEIDEVVIATTTNATDNPIEELGRGISAPVFRGSEDDVLRRVLDAARSARGDILVEVTGDCPLTDPEVIRGALGMYFEENAAGRRVDYVQNFLKKGFPVGMWAQVFPVALLEEVERKAKEKKHREHVSLYIYEEPGRYRVKDFPCPEWLRHPEWRCTLDYAEDYGFFRRIFDELYPAKTDFGARELVELLKRKPELLELNRSRA